ncbi:hypothetical protein V8E36_009337 [Tilletia maclaganii]
MKSRRALSSSGILNTTSTLQPFNTPASASSGCWLTLLPLPEVPIALVNLMAPKKSKKAPRCQQGCLDPTDPTQQALKASCSCARGKKVSTSAHSAAANVEEPLARPSPPPPGQAEINTAQGQDAERDEIDAVIAGEARRAAEAALAINEGRIIPSFALVSNTAIPLPARSGEQTEDEPEEETPGNVASGSIAANDGSVQHEEALDDNDDASGESNDGPEQEKLKEKEMTDKEQQRIWYNLGEAHAYTREHFKREVVAEKRNKRVNKSLWRIIKSGAEFSARTDSAMLIAWSTLEPGRQKQREVFWASENLCDQARPSLFSMTQDIHKRFHRDVATYREAQMAESEKHAAEKAAWQAERIEMLACIAALEQTSSSQAQISSSAEPSQAM